MKKIIAGLMVIATITFSAKAQTTRKKSDKAQNENGKNFSKKDHNQMAEKLQLTDDQKQQMKSINLDFNNRMKELKSNSNLTADELKTKKEALMQERKQKTMALLTPAQKDKFNGYKKGKHDERKMDATKRMEKMKEKLALSDDQVAKLNAQRELYETKEEAIKTNQALSADQRNEQFKALREERKNNFKSIITPDQAKKMEEMKQKRTGKSA